jgi:hypothetical protein
MNKYELHQDVGRIALASSSTLNIDIRNLQVRVFNVTTMERLAQSHLYRLLGDLRLTCSGRESNLGLCGGDRAF